MDQVSVDDSTEDLNHLSISDAGDLGDVNDGDDSSQEEECYVKVSGTVPYRHQGQYDIIHLCFRGPDGHS